MKRLRPQKAFADRFHHVLLVGIVSTALACAPAYGAIPFIEWCLKSFSLLRKPQTNESENKTSLKGPRYHSDPARRANFTYEPLPRALGPSDGTNLAVSIRGGNYPTYYRQMGAAVNKAVKTLTPSIRARRVTPQQIEQMWLSIGAVRGQIAREILSSKNEAAEFGKKLPETPEEVLEEWKKDPVPGTREEAQRRLETETLSDGLVGQYHDRSTEINEQLGGLFRPTGQINFMLKGKEVSLPLVKLVPDYLSEKTALRLAHATHPRCVEVSRQADELVADTLNRPDLTESQLIEALATAHVLYINYPRFYRGTSSCTMAFNDAVLRAAFGKTLPAPREGTDPAYEVMLPPAQGIDETIRTYRSLFE